MKWPNHTDIVAPKKDPSGGLVMTEAYWLYGLLKLNFAFIGFGFFWAVHDLPGGSGSWWLGLPCYFVAVFGVPDIFFRRRFTFFPKSRHVRIQGFSLSRGRFDVRVGYEDISFDIRAKWVLARPIHKRYFSMFHFPAADVAFFSSMEEQEAKSALLRLVEEFALSKDTNQSV